MSICNMDCFNCPFEDCINDKNAENRVRYWNDVGESRRKAREMYYKNRDRALASQKKYDDAHREKIREYHRNYFYENKERRKEEKRLYMREYYRRRKQAAEN